MKNILLKISPLFVLIVFFGSSCNKDLNRTPANSQLSQDIYTSPSGYLAALANVYGGYTLTGINGPNGNPGSDIAGVDGGTSDFVRCLWNVQELSTDEAICAWGDPGVPDFHNLSWGATDPILIGLYARCFYQITLCNDFIKHSTPDYLKTVGITGSDAAEIARERTEARFLRAYQYSILMDEFANPPFADENYVIGPLSFPPQISRADLFKYVESELLSCDSTLAPPHGNAYGRADQGAAWALLARLYLNAEIYTGTARYTDAITYSTKVINAGYSLMPHYADLFKADNNVNNPEVILAIAYDGINTQTYGGSTFLVNSATTNSTFVAGAPGYTMKTSDYGVSGGGWGGNRSTANLPALFPTPDSSVDKRGLFLNTQGVQSQITNVGTFIQGIPVIKYSNLTSTGAQGATANGVFCSTDYPLFRLAEQYLIYAEATLRGGSGGDIGTAVTYINFLRQRAYGNTNGNISAVDLTLPFILNERGRELYWECFRRTDLIRFNEFTSGSYLWPWKGGVSSGTGVDSHFNVYPIPVTDLQSNPNLKQNTGY